jgi:peptidoglycan hydrolase-like protein with peptidoglycan-binding domain
VNSFEYVSSKLGNVKPETRSIAKELYDKAKAAGHEIWFMWGMGSDVEHGSGLALDLMVHNEAAGDWVRNYIWANRSRLRLKHVIWEQHITSTVVSPGVRRLMGDRGNPTANHYDHVHAWFFAGSYRAPSGSTAPKPPASSPHATIKEGTKDTALTRKLQEFFRRVFPGYRSSVSVKRNVVISVDGDFGPQTTAWVKEFQERTGLKKDGIVGPATWTKLRSFGFR